MKCLVFLMAAFSLCGCASKPQLATLLEDIKSDSTDRRRAAAIALEDLGQPAIVPLRQLASEARDVSEKRCILDVVEEIDRLQIQVPPNWSNDEVPVALRLERRNLIVGDYVDLVLQVFNWGDTPVSVSKVGLVSLQFDLAPTIALQMFMNPGEVRIQVERVGGLDRLLTYTHEDAGKESEPSVIAPGKDLSIRLRIRNGPWRDQEAIPEGTYRLRASVNLIEKAREPLMSSNWHTLYVSK